MKKRNGLFRLLLLLALIICTSMPLSVFAAEETIDDIPVEDMVLPEPPDAGAEANPDPYAIMPLAYRNRATPLSFLTFWFTMVVISQETVSGTPNIQLIMSMGWALSSAKMSRL